MVAFTVENWKLVPTPELLQIAAFRDILEADRTRTKDAAISDLLYVYGMMQPRGPYSDFPVLDRDRKVRKNCYGEVDAGPYDSTHPVRWGRIVMAMRAYIEHNDNAEQRLVNELNESIDWITNSLRNMRKNPEASASEISAVIRSIKEVNSLLTNKKEAEKILQVGLDAAKTKSKGGADASFLEKGLFRAVLGKE